ncbi:uncharacterized protein LAJ45_06027 [Morchella importuna]|uniref:uncharacterized protein n=1 Tax=Morchella importuna TaxID=1174673 RepID=UPI001E8CF6DA|nr:uncharacterized protein LAJ45_06027 [Morchella importuna]KAH8149875.1 hypothetical protein LAJ45_06027 [Morchella importuna]
MFCFTFRLSPLSLLLLLQRYHSCTGPIKDVPLHEFISYRGKSSTQSSPGYCLVAFGLRALDRRQPTKLHPPTGACNSSCTSIQYIAEREPRPAQMMSHKSVCLQTYHVVADPRCQKTKEILRAPPLPACQVMYCARGRGREQEERERGNGATTSKKELIYRSGPTGSSTYFLLIYVYLSIYPAAKETERNMPRRPTTHTVTNAYRKEISQYGHRVCAAQPTVSEK